MIYRATLISCAAIFASAECVLAQESELISSAIDRFVENCSEAMLDPKSYFEEARSEGIESGRAVARVPEEPIFMVIDMMSPGEMSVHFGEIGNEARVFCQLGLFNVPEVMDVAATNEAFLAWHEAQDAIERTGGPVDLKALMAGDQGMTGEQVELTAQVYQHLMKGWSPSNATAEVVVQVGMLELSTQIMLPQPLNISD